MPTCLYWQLEGVRESTLVLSYVLPSAAAQRNFLNQHYSMIQKQQSMKRQHTFLYNRKHKSNTEYIKSCVYNFQCQHYSTYIFCCHLECYVTKYIIHRPTFSPLKFPNFHDLRKQTLKITFPKKRQHKKCRMMY